MADTESRTFKGSSDQFRSHHRTTAVREAVEETGKKLPASGRNACTGYTWKAAIRPDKHHWTGNDRSFSGNKSLQSKEPLPSGRVPIGRESKSLQLPLLISAKLGPMAKFRDAVSARRNAHVHEASVCKSCKATNRHILTGGMNRDFNRSHGVPVPRI